MRFAEVPLALTPEDFNFEKEEIDINNSWDYKSKYGSFQPTKNKSFNRTIVIGWKTASPFKPLVKGINLHQPIFIKPGKRVYSLRLMVS